MELWLLFFGLLAVVLGPVVAVMRRDFGKPALLAHAALSRENNPPYILGLVGVHCALYALVRGLVVVCAWKHNAKTTAQHKEDLFRLMLLTVVIATVARAQHRLHEHGHSYAALVAYYALAYSCIFQVSKVLPGAELSLTTHTGQAASALLLLLLLVTALLAMLYRHYLLARGQGPHFLRHYLLTVGAVLAVHVGLFASPGSNGVHVHHYYWAWLLAHLCLFHDDTSRMAQALFSAIFIHGLACFGHEPLFYDPGTTPGEIQAAQAANPALAPL